MQVTLPAWLEQAIADHNLDPNQVLFPIEDHTGNVQKLNRRFVVWTIHHDIADVIYSFDAEGELKDFILDSQKDHHIVFIYDNQAARFMEFELNITLV